MKKIFNIFSKSRTNIGNEWDNKFGIKESEIDEFTSKFINTDPARFDEYGNYSLEYILASSGSTISDRLRDDRVIEIDNEIIEMVSSYQIKTPVVVYRGLPKELLKNMKSNAKGIKGVDLIDKGFLSTSLVKGHENEGEIYLRIFVDKGINAVYMGDVNDEKNRYYELTIQHGAQLKILSTDEEYINCLLLKTA